MRTPTIALISLPETDGRSSGEAETMRRAPGAAQLSRPRRVFPPWTLLALRQSQVCAAIGMDALGAEEQAACWRAVKPSSR